MSVFSKPQPFTKPQTFDGNETALPVVTPSLFGATRTPWLDADDHSAQLMTPWQQAPAHATPTILPWQRADVLMHAFTSSWRQAPANDADITLPWSKLAPLARDAQLPWTRPEPHAMQSALPWEQFAQQLAQAIGAPWHTPEAHSVDASLRWGALLAQSMRTSTVWRRLAALGAYIALPWGTGSNYQTGYKTPFVNHPDDGSPFAFPNLPVYLMIPTFSAYVISSGADLKALNITIPEDVDSWCASVEMQIPAESLHLVNPCTNTSPVQVRVIVNGFPWQFIIESYTDNRKWGARGYTIRGRSPSAILADPNAPQRSLLQASDYNIAQLAANEVASTGWTSIWDAIDFLVPGGTWSYNDLVPIAAMQALAQSVGAVLLTDADAQNIRVEPRYPVLPWNWDSATPYAVLPATLLDGASGDWRGGSNPNGIFVYAKNASSGAFVRITGSGGAPQTTMVVHELLVTNPGQAARGAQDLAKGGRIKQEQITIPLLPAPATPSLIPLQSLLEITDETGTTWRGQVMGRTITASRGAGPLSVRQVLTMERQFR